MSPLKIRGDRGVMEVTPFVPLSLRGRFRESPYFKEDEDTNIWYNAA
jgi:hypothetical protein